MVADDHPEIGDELTWTSLGALPLRAVYQRPYDAPATRPAQHDRDQSQVEVSVQTFQLLPPESVEGTRRVAMIQERLARKAIPRSAAVRVLPCPFEAVPVREAMWWHPVHAQDAGHIWLRQKAGGGRDPGGQRLQQQQGPREGCPSTGARAAAGPALTGPGGSP